jgi:hypothetical protein
MSSKIKDDLGQPLSDSQLHFGEMQLECTANRWGVTPLQAAKIMIDVAYIKEAWNWVNMDEFLNSYIHQNTTGERPETRSEDE